MSLKLYFYQFKYLMIVVKIFQRILRRLMRSCFFGGNLLETRLLRIQYLHYIFQQNRHYDYRGILQPIIKSFSILFMCFLFKYNYIQFLVRLFPHSTHTKIAKIFLWFSLFFHHTLYIICCSFNFYFILFILLSRVLLFQW